MYAVINEETGEVLEQFDTKPSAVRWWREKNLNDKGVFEAPFLVAIQKVDKEHHSVFKDPLKKFEQVVPQRKKKGIQTFAIYKGETIIMIGTAREIAEKYEVDTQIVYGYAKDMKVRKGGVFKDLRFAPYDDENWRGMDKI
ncbi:hypothetical protein [Facklamia sp. P12934]|uniref:hypothetical protein n=1 Tax=unclassified Facklamia TaxID=2622293 RepID=UPI003D174F6A